MNKSRKLIIYEAKDGGQLFLNATAYKNNRFTTKNPPNKYGKAVSPNITNEQLGKTVREVLKKCD